jgi:hypothetical protein
MDGGRMFLRYVGIHQLQLHSARIYKTTIWTSTDMKLLFLHHLCKSILPVHETSFLTCSWLIGWAQLHGLVICSLWSFGLWHGSILKMEAVRSSLPLAPTCEIAARCLFNLIWFNLMLLSGPCTIKHRYNKRRAHNPEDYNMKLYRRENPKSHTVIYIKQILGSR